MGGRHACQIGFRKYNDYKVFKYELMHRYDRDGKAAAEEFCRKCGRNCRRWEQNEGPYFHEKMDRQRAMDAQIRRVEMMHSGYAGTYGVPPSYYGSMKQYSNDYYQTQKNGFVPFMSNHDYDSELVINELLLTTIIIVYLLIIFICFCLSIICGIYCILTKKLKSKEHAQSIEYTDYGSYNCDQVCKTFM